MRNERWFSSERAGEQASSFSHVKHAPGAGQQHRFRALCISLRHSWAQTLHIDTRQIWEEFDLSSSTMQATSTQIRDLLDMSPMDPDWSTPSMSEQNPLIWMLEVNGLIIDVRQAPREIQEIAFREGLIPSIAEV